MALVKAWSKKPVPPIARAQSWVRVMLGDLICVTHVQFLCYAEHVVTMGGWRAQKSFFSNLKIKDSYFQNLFLKSIRTEIVIPKGSKGIT